MSTVAVYFFGLLLQEYRRAAYSQKINVCFLAVFDQVVEKKGKIVYNIYD